ncbi:hypothetical protein [Fibrisoma montanum]|uniref:hypothetical protein n=1 Tax=Fibrisoma montanum TaxID=2305895 RepID=UPI001314A976|nr:hypothetical protein [Fibrisoma montanum]
MTDSVTSFVGKTGQFYVRQRRADGTGFHDRWTVWPSVDAYNQRTPVQLAFCDTADAVPDFSYEVRIYQENLKTIPPDYKPDRDETDFGLSRRDWWHQRFKETEL